MGKFIVSLTLHDCSRLSEFQFFLCGRAEFLEDLAFVLFAFFNVIWATLYLESWKRRSAELSYQWGTADERTELLTDPRPLFKVSYKVTQRSREQNDVARAQAKPCWFECPRNTCL